MKTITKIALYLQVAALCLTTALAQHPNVKEKQLRGSILSVETGDVQFPTLFVDGSGTGQATHLGQFTYTYVFEVDLPTGIGVGTAEFTAANGDRLFTEVAGSLGPKTSPGFNHVVEEQTIVGGTGRFAGASGSFTLDRLINLTTEVSVGTVDGTIVLRKKKHCAK